MQIIKKFLLPTILIFAAGAYAAGVSIEKQRAAAENARQTAAAENGNASLPAPTPGKKNRAAGNKQNKRSEQPPPQKADAETAYSPVYAVNSKLCRNDSAGNIGDGDEFQKVCKGFGGYELVLSGFDYRVKHEIRSRNFSVMLFPLPAGEASEYERADLYDLRLGEKIEWRLENGKPYAIIVRAAFYRNTGSAKTFANPKNKVAEFVFVRGLKGFEDLRAMCRRSKRRSTPTSRRAPSRLLTLRNVANKTGDGGGQIKKNIYNRKRSEKNEFFKQV